jgi:uncharacterized membrane protein
MIASLLTCLVMSTAPQGEYEYEALPLPPVSQANDINNLRQVVGFTASMGPPMAFICQNGQTTLFSYPNAIVTIAWGISDAGDIVGSFSPTGDPLDQRAFIRDAAGTFTSFQFPGATTLFTSGIGINNQGDIVGFYLDASDFQLHGYVRYADGTVQGIDHPAANGLTIALGISDSGVIDGARNDFNLGVPEVGYTLQDGAFTDVLVPGSTSTNVIHSNNRGDLVGNFHPTENNPFAPGGPAFLRGGRGITIMTFPGAEDTDLFGVNDRGDAVGSYFPDDQGPPFAFIARRVMHRTR